MTLAPFDLPSACVKCRAREGSALTYCIGDCLSVGGDPINLATLGAAPTPHLHRTCRACRYTVLMQTADAVPAIDLNPSGGITRTTIDLAAVRGVSTRYLGGARCYVGDQVSGDVWNPSGTTFDRAVDLGFISPLTKDPHAR
jgi:hypothetical protein